jgi:hypothetical protein
MDLVVALAFNGLVWGLIIALIALGRLYLAPRFEALCRQSPSIRIELITASH